MSNFLTPKQILDLATEQWDNETIAEEMAATALIESQGGNPHAIGDGGSSLGLYQVNRIHFPDLIGLGYITLPEGEELADHNDPLNKQQWEKYARPVLFDPVINTKIANDLGTHQEPRRGKTANEAGRDSFFFHPWESTHPYIDTVPGEHTEFMGEGEWRGLSAREIILRASAQVTPKGRTRLPRVKGTMGRGEWAMVRNHLASVDPELASLLKEKESILLNENTVIVDPSEAEQISDRELAKHGLQRDRDLGFILFPFGATILDDLAKAGKSALESDFAKALWNKAKGAAMWGMPEDMNPKSFSTPDEWPDEPAPYIDSAGVKQWPVELQDDSYG
jgi:hypothetical protein